MNMKIIPGKLSGTIDAIPSKSHAHRVLIAQKLAQLQGQKKPDALMIPSFSEDITATKNCLVQLDKSMPFLDCKESGSTLRFTMPVAMALKNEAVFIGSGKLPYRPLSPLKEEMEAHGCRFIMSGSHQNVSDKYKEICTIKGTLQPGGYHLAGNVSSQFISGLLFALPLLVGDSTLALTTQLESAGYVDLTLDVLKSFGIEIGVDTNEDDSLQGFKKYTIKGNQRYVEPDGLMIEGDWSNAAFWLACGALGGDITCRGLSAASSQRDKQIVTILKSMGAEINALAGDPETSSNSATPDNPGTSGNSTAPGNPGTSGNSAAPGTPGTADDPGTLGEASNEDNSPPTMTETSYSYAIRCRRTSLNAAEVSVAQIPDLVPVLAAVMSLANGASIITNAERLKIKESDRLQTVFDLLLKLGADITYGGEGLSITGMPVLAGGEVDGHNDHRIVMAAAVASCGCENPVIIRGAEAVNKSYPHFFDDFTALGGKTEKISE